MKFMTFIFLIISLLVFISGLILTLYVSPPYIYALNSSSWPSTEGIVVESSMTIVNSGDSNTTKYNFKFEYSVNGENYISNKIFASQDITNNLIPWPDNFIKDHPVGSQILVYYNPNNPSDGIIIKGANSNLTVVLIFSLIVLLIGFSSLFYTITNALNLKIAKKFAYLIAYSYVGLAVLFSVIVVGLLFTFIILAFYNVFFSYLEVIIINILDKTGIPVSFGSLVFYGIGLLFLWKVYSNLKYQVNTKKWPASQIELKNHHVEDYTLESYNAGMPFTTTEYSLHIDYMYDVYGHSYNNTFECSIENAENGDKFFEQMKKSVEGTVVYYNPDNPNIIVTDPGVSIESSFESIWGYFSCLISVIFGIHMVMIEDERLGLISKSQIAKLDMMSIFSTLYSNIFVVFGEFIIFIAIFLLVLNIKRYKEFPKIKDTLIALEDKCNEHIHSRASRVGARE